jgi:DASS family divalent anion:Na+ symporter
LDAHAYAALDRPLTRASFLPARCAQIATKVLTFQMAFSAFTSDVIWLIVISFFFAKGFVKTGLGDRVANFFVTVLGKSTLGLSYGLVLSEALISPAMPSTTARAGGVFLPIILSLSKQAGSLPGATATRLGAFLVQAQLQSCAHSSALFLTAAAQNLLALKLAAEVTGVPLANPWVTWFVAASVPAILSLLATPLAVFKLLPPQLKNTPDAPDAARARLAAMGPPSRDEKIMVGTMALAVTLWVFGDALGVPSVLAAMIGLCMLLVGGVLQWSDCLAERSAWDTLMWFAVLVGMSGQLNALGLVRFVSDAVAASLTAAHLSWPFVAVLMNLAYFFMHYIFASQTAHVGALLAACLGVMTVAGVPPVLGTLTLAYTTNLFGAITHYSSGQAAVYYGAGYTDLPTTFRLGAICAGLNLGIWGVVGGIWWKIIGLW